MSDRPTPKDIASRIADDTPLSDDYWDDTYRNLVRDIANAIREAEAAALERAATIADKIADDPPYFDRPEHWQSGWQDGAMEVASSIRSLIAAGP